MFLVVLQSELCFLLGALATEFEQMIFFIRCLDRDMHVPCTVQGIQNRIPNLELYNHGEEAGTIDSSTLHWVFFPCSSNQTQSVCHHQKQSNEQHQMVQKLPINRSFFVQFVSSQLPQIMDLKVPGINFELDTLCFSATPTPTPSKLNPPLSF